MTTTEVPQPWADQMRRRGITDPKDADRPTMRALSRSSGVSVPSISRLVLGTGESRPETVAKVAEALGLDVRVVSDWAGQQRAGGRPYQPHVDADLLTPDEQAAVNRLIGLMTKGRKSYRSRSSNDGESDHQEDPERTATGDGDQYGEGPTWTAGGPKTSDTRVGIDEISRGRLE